MDLRLSAKYLYADDQVMSVERDPLGFLSATDRIDASVVLSSNSGNRPWSVAVVGRNLTNEIVHTFVNSSTDALRIGRCNDQHRRDPVNCIKGDDRFLEFPGEFQSIEEPPGTIRAVFII